MSKQHEQHGKSHSHHAPKKKPIHKDWRAWLVVGLMIGAMVIYILSLNEEVEPGNDQEQPAVPAAAE